MRREQALPKALEYFYYAELKGSFEIFRFLVAVFILCARPTLADGPDYFRLADDADLDEVMIYAAPSMCSRSIAQLPASADRIRNYGCEGGLGFSEWMSATPADREASRERIWCEIEHAGV